MNKLTDKTMGDVVIVRRPHRFKPTVTWFSSIEDAYKAYNLWSYIAEYKNFKDFADTIGDEDEARRELEGSDIGDDEHFYEITSFPDCCCPVEYVKELNLDSMLNEAVSNGVYIGQVFVAKKGELWGEFLDRIYHRTRGHNEPDRGMLLDACYIEISLEKVKEIRLEGGQFIIGEYSIAGNYDDGYTVWRTDDGEDSETLYENISFEKCVTWCLTF